MPSVTIRRQITDFIHIIPISEIVPVSKWTVCGKICELAGLALTLKHGAVSTLRLEESNFAVEISGTIINTFKVPLSLLLLANPQGVKICCRCYVCGKTTSKSGLAFNGIPYYGKPRTARSGCKIYSGAPTVSQTTG